MMRGVVEFGDCVLHAGDGMVGGFDELGGFVEVQLYQCRDSKSANSTSCTAEEISVLLVGGSKDRSISKHHLNRVQRAIEEAMLEGTTLS